MKIEKGFAPLEKAADFNQWPLPVKTDGSLKPPLVQIVRGRNSLMTGFTLMEVVVATLVMVVVIVGLSQGVSLYSRSVDSVRQQDVALYAAQEKLEEIATDIENVLSYNGHFNITDSAGTNLITLPSGDAPGSVVVAQNPDVADLFSVNVTIAWNSFGRQQSLTLNTAFIQK